MTLLPVIAFNFEGGGRTTAGGYDFHGLHAALGRAPRPPALILFCQANSEPEGGGKGLYAAAEALYDEFNIAYGALLGRCDRRAMPRAIFYDAARLAPRTWIDRDDPNPFWDKVNVGRFAVLGSGPTTETRKEFVAWVDHWPANSPPARYEAATRLERYAEQDLPVIAGGDLNEHPSGEHYPRWDPEQATYLVRTRKGIRVDGRWTASTAAVDHLVGRWNPELGKREEGAGYHLLSELAWEASGRTLHLPPTVITKPGSGGQLAIDHLICNRPMLRHINATSFRVLTATPGERPGSDHYPVYAEMEI
jgi:endonuclease/exonuclease/phosphatase family metal-dependent hydrolase